MEEVMLVRLKLIYDSVQSHTNSAQHMLKNSTETNIKELELIKSTLKSINLSLISEIHTYCKSVTEPNIELIRQYTETQIKAVQIIAEIETTIQENNRKQCSTSISSENISITSKLPRIELAKFDGNILKWYQFWDQFTSNIDNRNISDVDKLLYLQSVLEGDAKQTIMGLDTTNKNYTIAVNTLKERYGKPSAIIDAHYVALYRIKTAKTNQAKDCRHILAEIERHLRVLSSLGEDVNHNHLRVMIMEKFPEDLIYELRMKMAGEDESIDNIRKYLEYIISARETSNRLKKDTLHMENVDTSIVDTKTNNDDFTLGSMHVKAQEIRDKRQGKFTNFKRDKIKFETRKHNFFLPTRKRPFDKSDRTDEPPNKKSVKCIFCLKDHFNDECTTYKTIKERKSQLGNRCYNCFGEGHRFSSCRSKRKCKHCNKFGIHNRALCPTKIPQSVDILQTKNMHVKANSYTTVLQTCVVKVYNADNEKEQLQCRILLDCGSQRSYITKNFANLLNLPSLETNNLSIFTFGSKSPRQIESPVVKFKIITRTGISRLLYANVVPHITHDIQIPVFNNTEYLYNDIRLKNLIMADDGSCGDKIDILIGNDYYNLFMLQEQILVTQNLFLINSDFGWIWSGKINDLIDKSNDLSALTYFQSHAAIDNKLSEPDLPLKCDDIKILWDLESIGITDSPNSNRDEAVIKQFNESVQFHDNRYYVKWPWVDPSLNLPSNFGLAYGRLNSLIKRLDCAEIKAYDHVIQEQLSNGIIEIVPNPNVKTQQKNPVHYLPHHGVYSKDKSNKLRIVYDASAKTKDNRSLNECLYRGPLILEDLTGLLIKFREHPIGLIADVEKAFLQLGLQRSDRDVTRFLWLKDIRKGVSFSNILHLRFCRVPFGVISSPFLLNATIKFHLMKCNNPVLKQVAEDIYVDNVVTGAKTIPEAIELFESSRHSFQTLSMNLREWTSNCKEILSHIPAPLTTNTSKNQVKVLGLQWNVDNDRLCLKINFNGDLVTVQTKRDVLKTIASVYDPCGIAIPIILPAKLFFQRLWKLKIMWDTKLNNSLLNEWRQIVTKFPYMKEIQVDRYFARNLNAINDQIQFELHCFTDASLVAYAAVIYLRCTSDTNNVVNFVIGKSRLVPLKEQSTLQIPKLELLGVFIGYRLIKYVLKFLRLNVKDQYLWTDSQVVLSWCKSEKLLSPFVSRRITEIKQNKALQFRFVPSHINPADVGTRAEQVDSYKRWLNGPDFLLRDVKEWPEYSNIATLTQIENTMPGEGLVNPTPRNETEKSSTDRIEPLISHNLDRETKNIIEAQKEHFPKEVMGLSTDFSRALKLYKDEHGVIRCKGRFKYADLSHDQKEPILLPKNSEFTHKIIKDIHDKNYHVGVSHTLTLLRQKFWVPHGRATVQKIIKRCPQCIKYGGGPYKLPVMPDLPAERVKLTVPFAFTGLDYFGPLTVNEVIKEKRWVCLFTCLTIRAIHMEFVKDLSAEECLLAIRRFVASRGLPQLIISDNAMQFKLTADVLTSDYCIQNNLRWKFIPELAPWFGGFYERLIGLVKHSLKRTLDKHLVNHNQLFTVIKEIEAVVNTRPLTVVGTEMEHVLSPIDFLRVGGSVTTEIADREFLGPATVTKSNLIEGWKRGQIILEEFTKMFNSQYLTCLRERQDRHREPRIVTKREPKILDTVQIKSDGNRAHWRIGKIMELIKGLDGHIRVAKVKLSTGETLTRSIGHLYPLEVDDEQISSSENPILGSDLNTDQLLIQPKVPIQSDQSAKRSNDYVEIPDRNTNSQELSEPSTQSPAYRPLRISAIKAKEKLKEWTSQLLTRLFEH